jgi:hypothetical protein
MLDLAQRLTEFDVYVWTHTADAFQMQFDVATDFDPASRDAIAAMAEAVLGGASVEDVAATIGIDVRRLGSEHLAKLIQLVGLTRNKLTTDLDSMLRLAGEHIRVPAWDRLPAVGGVAWSRAREELATRFRAMIVNLGGGLDRDQILGVLEALNRATWPGYIRQERAKRGGHEAEGRLARVAQQLRVGFEPAVKAENPMAADAQIDGLSYDLVFPEADHPAVCVKSTVHTANIGQYGESKDALEIREAREALDARGDGVILLALADGLGFRSNRAGLEAVLTYAHEVCQFRTLWKAIVIAANRAGRTDLRLYLPDRDRTYFAPFLGRYGFSEYLLDDAPQAGGVAAGDGLFIRQ